MSDLRPALEAAVAAAQAAGQLLREEFHRPGGPRGSDRSHAFADEEAERLLRERLLGAIPEAGFLGEETGAQSGNGTLLWLVDPNDGTASYLRGWRGSAVSVALLDHAVPVLGVVFAFGYPDDRGDLIAWAEGQPLTRNGRTIPTRPLTADLGPAEAVFVSQGADRRAEENARCVHPGRYLALPSIAYRLARVACGDAAAGVSLNYPNGWDYGAGHALLRACGG